MNERTFVVEQDWTTHAGFRAVVIMGSMGFRCGYVGLPAGHPLHGVGYSNETAALRAPDECESIGKRGTIPVFCAALGGGFKRSPEDVFDVHGSLTFADGSAGYPVPSELWWFGFDCGHAGDAPSDEYLEERRIAYPDQPFMWRRYEDSIHRTLSYCMEECESLAAQIASKTVGAGA